MVELSPQMEDYLEAILEISREGGVARVKDVSQRLGVTSPSVVGAVRTLKSRRLAHQERYGVIRLTAQGEAIARSVLGRHRMLADFLEGVLGLPPETAAADACRIEHAVSPETVSRLRAIARFLESKAHGDLDWPAEFRAFCESDSEETR